MKIGFSTQLGKELLQDIKFAEDYGFNALCLELSWNPNLKFNEKEIAKLKEYSNKGNTLCVHMPFFLYVNTSINEVFEGLKKYFKKTINFCEKVGIKTITFHAGYVEQIEDYKNNDSLKQNLKELMGLVNGTGILLSIENDDKGSDYPLWSLEELKQLLSEVQLLKCTFDPGHANTAGYKVQEFYDVIKSRVNVVHLHNNCGKDSHESLDKGDINFKQFLSKNFKEDIIYILEVFPYDKIIKNKKLIEQYLKQSR